MRRRRFIQSGKLYELCFRAREGLPFPALSLIELIIKSAVARTQRDSKVTICHMIWMANHVHFLVLVKDSLQCMKFCGELQKRITDCLKQLLGLSHLSLWEGNFSAAQVLDLDAAVKRIAYFYLNPTRASLVNSINEYPGISTWQAFQNLPSKIDSQNKEVVPWIRLPSVPELPTRSLSSRQDIHFTRILKKSNTKTHTLELEPNAWFKSFGIEDEAEIAQVNSRIRAMVEEGENYFAERRSLDKNGVVGKYRLKSEPILKSHVPKIKERRICVISTDKSLRVAFIKMLDELAKQCRELYRLLCRGISVVWPPGVFPPSGIPQANAIAGL